MLYILAYLKESLTSLICFCLVVNLIIGLAIGRTEFKGKDITIDFS